MASVLSLAKYQYPDKGLVGTMTFFEFFKTSSFRFRPLSFTTPFAFGKGLTISLEHSPMANKY
jgi:hypothetical protein